MFRVMKTALIKILFGSALAAVSLSSCKGFLEEYSPDEVVPKNVREYSELLFGESYFRGEKLPFEFLELMTDDVEATYNGKNTSGDDTRQAFWGYFTWQSSPELSPTGVLNSDGSWQRLYHQIFMANVVLKHIGDMDGLPEDIAQLEGEAYSARLFAYYMLANMYGEPYNPATAAQALGVPINDKTYAVDTVFARASLQANYQQMRSDADKALEAFSRGNGSRSPFRWNAGAAAVLASRVALYMQDWKAAIDYADKALEVNSSLYNLNSKQTADASNSKGIICDDNPELLFTYGFYQSTPLSTGHLYFFSPSAALTGSFEQDDLRYWNGKGLYIKQTRVRIGGSFWKPIYAYYYAPAKGAQDSYSGRYGYGLRSAEAYLNKAEAFAMLGEADKALEQLNILRLARFKTGSKNATALMPDSPQGLIELVRAERRREFCFEFQRWFDLRRWDRPEIKHSYITNGEEDAREEHVLQSGDPRYTLPIPTEVLNSDAALSKG